jgi:uncharacterized protein YjbI with pentapeptide repeats
MSSAEKPGREDITALIAEFGNQWSIAHQYFMLGDSEGRRHWSHLVAGRIIPAWSMRNTDLRGAEFYRAALAGADFTGANLSHANLIRAFMVGANMAHANLKGALLTKANLQQVNFYRANLSGVSFHRCDLEDAVLRRANLEFADLSRARLVRTDLRDVKFNDFTKWPPRFTGFSRNLAAEAAERAASADLAAYDDEE